MTLKEVKICAEQIEVASDGSLQVRDATIVLRNGKRDPAFHPRYHRYVLHPGADLAGLPARVVAVANAVWTADVVAAWRVSQPDG